MPVSRWLVHHVVKLCLSEKNLPHQMCIVKDWLCGSAARLGALHSCRCVMEIAAVYLGVRFGTGRGEALRLFDCFIMVIYMAIYLCILCYVCHYMYISECLFVCVLALVCVRPSREGSVFGPPCEPGWLTAWASGLGTLTHIQCSQLTHVSQLIFQHVFYSINVSWPNTYQAPKQTCSIKME